MTYVVFFLFKYYQIFLNIIKNTKEISVHTLKCGHTTKTKMHLSSILINENTKFIFRWQPRQHNHLKLKICIKLLIRIHTNVLSQTELILAQQ